jgi:hypothetical protein
VSPMSTPFDTVSLQTTDPHQTSAIGRRGDWEIRFSSCLNAHGYNVNLLAHLS